MTTTMDRTWSFVSWIWNDVDTSSACQYSIMLLGVSIILIKYNIYLMIVPIDYSNVFWRFVSINFISNVYIPKFIYGYENYIKVMAMHKKLLKNCATINKKGKR